MGFFKELLASKPKKPITPEEQEIIEQIVIIEPIVRK